MFGYIGILKDELKIKDFNKYQSYYCGVCHSLRNRYGFVGQVTLTYDMTFLAIVLSSLYEDSTEAHMERCVAHPIKKHGSRYNYYTDYAAAMNIMLTYYKMKDDWEDEKSVKANTMALILLKAYKKAKIEFPIQAEAIELYIEKQKKFEKRQEANIELVASATGDMLAALFLIKEDIWKDKLTKLGYYLGEFIYIMDAFEDIPNDMQKKNYNPFLLNGENPKIQDECKEMLELMAAESAKAFEALPIIENAEILRNILYAGIWNKFDRIITERYQEKDSLKQKGDL